MSLLFPRLARNLAKAGFYPTDQATVEACKRFMIPSEDEGTMPILDPCCGQGDALQALSEHLGKTTNRVAYGVEFDAERAYQAKEKLDHCIHADINDCVIGSRQFSLLFLNPPYGGRVTDHCHVDNDDQTHSRLEKVFYQRCYTSLAFGGVLVLILPDYSFDRQYRRWIERNFCHLTALRASDPTFKQVVLLGVRKRTSTAALAADKQVLQTLKGLPQGESEIPGIDSEAENEYRYRLPGLEPVKKFHSVRIDSRQLSGVLGNTFNRGLWPTFNSTFNRAKRSGIQPLCRMSQWHMALALAAGQLNGLVEDKSGRKLLVKGDTYKSKKVSHETQMDHKGHSTLVQVSADTFVASIVGIDFTPGSASYGNLIRIR